MRSATQDRFWPDRLGSRTVGLKTDYTNKVLGRLNALWPTFARPNSLKFGYWQDQTDRNVGVGQTEQSKIAVGQTDSATEIFPDQWVGLNRIALSTNQVILASTCLRPGTSSCLYLQFPLNMQRIQCTRGKTYYFYYL